MSTICHKYICAMKMVFYFGVLFITWFIGQLKIINELIIEYVCALLASGNDLECSKFPSETGEKIVTMNSRISFSFLFFHREAIWQQFEFSPLGRKLFLSRICIKKCYSRYQFKMLTKQISKSIVISQSLYKNWKILNCKSSQSQN